MSPSSKRSRPKQIVRTPRRSPLVTSLDVVIPSTRRGLGAHSAGQSGDTQGLSNVEETDSESVEELVEEGQDFEAGAVAGIEEADASQGEVRTKQVPEDDVPREYLENDLDRLNRKSPVTREHSGETDCNLRHAGQSGTSRCPRKASSETSSSRANSKRMGEPRGKQMGQKNAKRADRGGRR